MRLTDPHRHLGPVWFRYAQSWSGFPVRWPGPEVCTASSKMIHLDSLDQCRWRSLKGWGNPGCCWRA